MFIYKRKYPVLKFFEAKDNLIKKIPSLSDEQKQEVIDFFRKYNQKEREINWSNWRNLTFSDFEKVMKLPSKRGLRQKVKTEGITGLRKNIDYYTVFENKDKGILAVMPLNYEASKLLASDKIAGVEGAWCTAYQKTSYYFHKYMGFWFEAKTKNDGNDLEEKPDNWLVYVFNFKKNRKFGFYNENGYLRVVDEEDTSISGDDFLNSINLTEEEYEFIVENAEFFKNKVNKNREERIRKRKEEEIKKYKKYESGEIPVPNKEMIQEMFKKGLDITNLDTSQITNMSELFYGIKMIQNLDLSKWDVSNVKNMKDMFSNSNFNGDISNWDVSNVEDMRGMFSNSKFNGDISNWDVSNVEDMEGMFYNSPLENNPPSWYSG